MKYDVLVIGSGFSGAVFAERATRADQRVLVLEKRPHIGGNCYSYIDERTGAHVEQYGAHIFHTNDQRVWAYVNQFCEFNQYQHRVLTTYRGKVYAMPINLGTINQFFNVNLRPSEVAGFLEKHKPTLDAPAQNLEDKAISLIGKDLYDAFVKEYTAKQWGCSPRELPASIITRLPVRTSYNDNYFNDKYQGMPIDGYTPIFEKMLSGIEVQTNTDFFSEPEYWRKQAKLIVYTGPIDRYFDYTFGRLNWRSVRFEYEHMSVPDYQGTSVMNYADAEAPYTRVHEPHHFHPERKHSESETLIIREYAHVDDDAPYYPINLEPDRLTFEKYRNLANHEKDVLFVGRLAEYKYYDMHQVIAAALKLAGDVYGG